MNIIRLTTLLFILILPMLAQAGKGEIRFVETSVDLRGDGTAVVMYEIQWQVNSGEMHGFYFQGNDKLRVAMSKDQSAALDSDGNRYKLDLRKISNDKWDVLLADGKGVAAGKQLTYKLIFKTSFASAGYLGKTTSDAGRELVYFN